MRPRTERHGSSSVTSRLARARSLRSAFSPSRRWARAAARRSSRSSSHAPACTTCATDPDPPPRGRSTMNSELTPFRIEIADEQLDDLRDRLARTRWPDSPTDDAGWERGVPAVYLAGLVEYWQKGFDWRAQERALNALPQFVV